jgi:pyrroloquinoline quinone biosynthesis protein B
LFDASPDIKYQLNLLREVLGPHSSRPNRLRQPDGIFLTHGHMGHTAGLAHLGPEAMAVERLRIYGSSGLLNAIGTSRLWTPLIKNLVLVELEPYVPLELTVKVTVTPIPVPHRDELGSGTFAYRIDGESRSLLYLPDIDSWTSWSEAKDILTAVNVALVDASFYSRNELAGRDPVAHPLVPDTLDLFQEIPTRLVLTHLNHSNPLLDSGSEERQIVESHAAEVAFTGQLFEL